MALLSVNARIHELEREERLTISKMNSCFELAEAGDLDQLKEEINSIDLLEDRDDHGNTILHRCMMQCLDAESFKLREGMFKYILQEAPDLIEVKNVDGQTPLCLACKYVLYEEVIEMLLELYPDAVNEPDIAGWTPLHYVCTSFGQLKANEDCRLYQTSENILQNSVEIAELLVAHGANVNHETKSGHNTLQNTLIQKHSYKFCINLNDKKTHNEFIGQILTLLFKNNVKITSERINERFSQCIKTVHQAHFLICHYPKELKELEKTLIKSKLVYPFKNIEDDEIIEIFLMSGLFDKDLDLVKLAREMKFSLKVVKELLAKFPEYSINTIEPKYGNTIFIEYATTLENIIELLLLGANPLLSNKFGDNALVTAAKSYNIEAIEKLLELQLNPFEFSCNSCCSLKYICRILIKCDTDLDFENWLKVFKLIFQRPELEHLSTEKQTSLIEIMFSELLDFHIWSKIKLDRLKVVLTIIVDSMKGLGSLVMPKGRHAATYVCKPYMLENEYFSPFTYALTVLTDYNTSACKIVNVLLDSGMKLDEIPQICISPLTYLLLSDVKCNDHEVYDTFERVIKENVNLESSVLKYHITSTNEEMLMELNEIKIKYKVPDVLLLGILKKNDLLIRRFLNHWCEVPSALVIFAPKLHLPFMLTLLRYGLVPHGTELYKLVMEIINPAVEKLMNNHSTSQVEIWRKCKMITGSPLSLKQLCKTTVRRSVMERALQPDISLPKLLDQLLPPLLREATDHCNTACDL